MYICIFTFITPNTYYQSNSELNAENVCRIGGDVVENFHFTNNCGIQELRD